MYYKKHYGHIMYAFRSKLVRLSKPAKVIYIKEDTSLLQNKLPIFYGNGECTIKSITVT